MKYIEVDCKISPLSETNAEIIIAELSEKEFEGFIQTEEGVKAYIEESNFGKELIENIKAELNIDFNVEFSVANLPEKNWNEEWEKNYFKPIQIADKYLIKSSFHDTDKEAKHIITIDPKMAFGTGHHSTTSLVIELMPDMNIKGKKVVDMGSGTGIIAILASLQGAKNILAVDNDEWACKNTIENVKTNNAQNVEVVKGSVEILEERDCKFDLIVANINRNILLEHIKTYASKILQDGKLIISGFYTEDIEILEKEANKYGLEKISEKEKNKWAAVIFRKK